MQPKPWLGTASLGSLAQGQGDIPNQSILREEKKSILSLRPHVRLAACPIQCRNTTPKGVTVEDEKQPDFPSLVWVFGEVSHL